MAQLAAAPNDDGGPPEQWGAISRYSGPCVLTVSASALYVALQNARTGNRLHLSLLCYTTQLSQGPGLSQLTMKEMALEVELSGFQTCFQYHLSLFWPSDVFPTPPLHDPSHQLNHLPFSKCVYYFLLMINRKKVPKNIFALPGPYLSKILWMTLNLHSIL